MKFAVIQFPGSNCDQDCLRILRDVFGQPVRYVWHKETGIEPDEAIILPGGFSYGDYLRCGAIARFSPIMNAVKQAAAAGQIVIGICNGFQVLCEAGLLPGALIRNRDLHFLCDHYPLRVETSDSIFTSSLKKGQILNIPVAHGEGSYMADEKTLRELEKNDQILFRYVDSADQPTKSANPNGSVSNIAGIRNREGNILGMMPHPERASEALLGCTDGKPIFESVIQSTSRRTRFA